MLNEESHPSDQDLIMAADGELSAGRSAEVSRHLASCWPCRARMREIEETIADFVHLHRKVSLPPAAGPRALLRARMAEAGNAAPHYVPRRFGVAAMACVVVVAAAGIGYQALRMENAAAPQPRMTPGDVMPVSREDLCRSSSPAPVPAVPVSLKQQVFQEYGIANPRVEAYEIDYLITPELGGATTLRNLWPQPYYNTRWNARVKDQLEDRLHAMVCRGEIDLATAQHDIATNWISAYKKYFRTDRPLGGNEM